MYVGGVCYDTICDCRAGEKYGIYTLLDMHQDILSEKFCGEGIPDWAVDTGSKMVNTPVILCYYIPSAFTDAHGFPWPLGSPFKVDPNTGYPSKKVHMYFYRLSD